MQARPESPVAAPGDRTGFDRPQQTVAEATRTINDEGGEAFEPADPRFAPYRRTINQLLEDSFYESDDKQLAAVVRRFDAAANENPQFVLELAAYAREELYLRDVLQVLPDSPVSAGHSTAPSILEPTHIRRSTWGLN